MSRSRKSGLDRFIDAVALLPWWVSLAMGGVVWGVWWMTLVSLPANRTQVVRSVWWLFPLLFAGIAVYTWFEARRERHAFFAIRNLRALQRIPWCGLEEVAGAYYRELGFTLVPTEEIGKTDGGFDLVLRKDGERILVQCKEYTREAVGVDQVREFLGAVVSEGADRGIFITTSQFTPAAMEFGQRHSILEVIPGERFAQMISQSQGESTETDGWESAEETGIPSHGRSAPFCPRCHTGMVPRTVRRGAFAGQPFWGCPRYPVCDGTRGVF